MSMLSPEPAPRTVADLQRELLAICRGGSSFAETWRQVNRQEGRRPPDRWPDARRIPGGQMSIDTTAFVGILNVGAGDTKLSFDKSNPAERIRAARVVKDMLRRGYALLVEIEKDGVKKFTRAIDFDESVCEYIIADFDPIVAAQHDSTEAANGEQDEVEARDPSPTEARAKPARRIVKKRIPADSTRSVAVARTAGG